MVLQFVDISLAKNHVKDNGALSTVYLHLQVTHKKRDFGLSIMFFFRN